MIKQARTKNIILVYPEPDKSKESCGKLDFNQIVNISKENGEWYYITDYGWSNQKMFFEIIDESEVEENLYGFFNAHSLVLRSEPDINSNISDTIFNGDNIRVTDRLNNWSNINDKGWVKNNHISTTIASKSPDDTSTTDSTTVTDDSLSDDKGSTDKAFNLSKDYGYVDENIKNDEDAGAALLESKTWMFGMPYQYMSSVDKRIPGTRYGRKFASKILQNMPMFLVTPGKPKFMKGFSDADKDGVLKALVDSDKSILDAILGNSDKKNKNGKFYSLEFAYSEYYARVNPMCHMMARLLNLQDVEYGGTTLSSYNWANNQDEKFAGFISSKESVAFYIDSETQISESFSNNTGQSSLAGSVNQLSDLSRELQFLIGDTTGDTLDVMKSENYQATLDDFNSVTSKFKSILPSTLVDRLTQGVATVSSGGKLIFPEIYNDSEFSKSYDISVKLRTPDCDPLSIYLNLLVPLAHLIGLVAPAQLDANGYTSPFLIRAYYKGFFNIDMGIITNLSINKGDKGSWTLDGLPTKIDVTINLKDLYNIFCLSKENELFNMLHNTAELDYLANLCGINVNKVDIERSIDMIYYNTKNAITNKLTLNHFMGVQQYVSNLAKGIFGR